MILEMILCLMAMIYSEIIHMKCYQKCSNINEKFSLKYKIKIFFLICIISSINLLNNLYNYIYFTTYVSLFLLIILMKEVYKENIKLVIFKTSIISIISLILEMIFSKMVTFPFSNLIVLNENIIYKMLITIIFATILYFLFSLKKINQTIYKLSKDLAEKSNLLLGILVIIILINIITLDYGADYQNTTNYFIVVTSFILVLILIIATLILELKQTRLKVKNEFLLENLKNYEIIADDYAELKHNLNHDLMMIRSLANRESQLAIDEVIKKYDKNYNWKQSIANIPKGIQGLLCLKLYKANNYKLNVEINNQINELVINKMSIKTYSKLCECIGIVVDNAITAARKSQEKSIYIDMEEKDNLLTIKIMNTFKDCLDLDLIGSKNYSTKKIKSGIGLNYLNKLKMKNFKIKKEIINNIFIVSLFVTLKN